MSTKEACNVKPQMTTHNSTYTTLLMNLYIDNFQDSNSAILCMIN